MKLRELKKEILRTLQNARIEAATFETEVLLQEFCKLTRAEILTDAEKEIESEAVLSATEKRAAGEPLQYLIGHWEFWGMDLKVGEGVLIPRADTETTVETARELLRGKPEAVIADLCSGSGCIALALAKELPKSEVYALEKSPAAFAYLQENNKRYGEKIHACLCDVLLPQAQEETPTLDLLISNPPYIPSATVGTLSAEVQHEPRMALDGAEDGLFFYREITARWKNKLKPGGVLLFEIGFDQAQAVSEILEENGFDRVQVREDYGKNPRVVYGIRA